MASLTKRIYFHNMVHKHEMTKERNRKHVEQLCMHLGIWRFVACFSQAPSSKTTKNNPQQLFASDGLEEGNGCMCVVLARDLPSRSWKLGVFIALH
jgi:hypothetical protein